MKSLFLNNSPKKILFNTSLKICNLFFVFSVIKNSLIKVLFEGSSNIFINNTSKKNIFKFCNFSIHLSLAYFLLSKIDIILHIHFIE